MKHISLSVSMIIILSLLTMAIGSLGVYAATRAWLPLVSALFLNVTFGAIMAMAVTGVCALVALVRDTILVVPQRWGAPKPQTIVNMNLPQKIVVQDTLKRVQALSIAR